MKILKILIFAVLVFYPSFAEEKWEIIYKEGTDFNNIALGGIRSFEFDLYGNMYLATVPGQVLTNQDGNWHILADEQYIRSLQRSQDGKILWGVGEYNMMKYDVDTKNLSFFNRKDIMGDWNYEYFTGFTVDNNDNLWFLSRTPYLTKFDGEKFVDWDLDFSNKILKINLFSAYFTRDGDTSLWVTGNDGVLRFSTNSTPDNLLYQKYSNSDIHLDSGVAIQIFRDAHKNIWVSSSKGQVSYYDGQEWRALYIPDSLREHLLLAGYPNYIAQFYMQDSTNLLLFWQSSQFYLVVDSNLQISKRYFPQDIFGGEFPGVSCIKQDESGNIWLCSFVQNKSVIIKFTPSTSGISEEETDKGNLLPEVNIRCVYPNPANGEVTAKLLIYPDELDKLDIALYDYLGNTVMELTDKVEINLSSGEAVLKFNIGSLNQGGYLLCISKGNERRIKLIMKFN